MSEHTPGSWEIIESGRGPLDRLTIRQGVTSGRYVAEIRPRSSDDPAEVRANARLLRSAPGLLGALREINEMEADYAESGWAFASRMQDIAAAAITEATRKEPSNV